MLTIGQIIKISRINKKISQDDLAKKLKVSKNYVSLVENGHKDPSINFLKRVANILKIPLILLIWEKFDLPKGNTKEEKDLISRMNRTVNGAQRIFAERSFNIKKDEK